MDKEREELSNSTSKDQTKSKRIQTAEGWKREQTKKHKTKKEVEKN